MPTAARQRQSSQDAAEPRQVDIRLTHSEQRGHGANIATIKPSARSPGLKLAEPALAASSSPALQHVKQNMADHGPGQHRVYR